MQTRCRYEIFLVCFFVVKTTRVRLWHYKFSRYAPRIFFAKRLVCELPPVSLRISVIEFVKIAKTITKVLNTKTITKVLNRRSYYSTKQKIYHFFSCFCEYNCFKAFPFSMTCASVSG